MMKLLKFDRNLKVVNQWITDHAPEPGLFDATNRTDGPKYMGRTYDPGLDSFSPLVTPTQTRRQQLKDQLTWTDAERLEANDEVTRSLL